MNEDGEETAKSESYGGMLDIRREAKFSAPGVPRFILGEPGGYGFAEIRRHFRHRQFQVLAGVGGTDDELGAANAQLMRQL